MKKNLKLLAVFFTAICMAFSVACSDSENDNDGDGDGDRDGNGNTEMVSLGDGSDSYKITGHMTLTADNTYHLQGWVFVTNGATLTIEPGTVIKGDKETKATLIVERGGKIMAQGTKEKPIVFTSAMEPGKRSPEDWGGIIILGKAPNNDPSGEMTIEGGIPSEHGGTDPADNSGVLSYVRCEFAGVEYSTDNEINGITFGSVGTGTKIDHLQVSYSGDDAFEWFGGTVNCSHLVALGTWDDDYDTDYGFSGKIQYALAIRDPKIGDKSASNGFESDNNGNATNDDPHTAVVFSNVTIIGPVADPDNYVDESGVNGSQTGSSRFQAAMHLRRNTNLSIFNSVFVGYPIGLIIENDKNSNTQGHVTNGDLVISNCYLAGMVKNFQNAQYWENNTVYNPNDEGEFGGDYFLRSGSNNTVLHYASELGFTGDPFSLTNPGMFITSTGILASGADWSHSKVSSGFDQVSYIGAFGPGETASNNWTTGWCNFDPQNTVY